MVAHYTELAIMETLEDMLNEMPFDKITVSALVKRCEISPNTFYYHYQDIYDLLDHWLAAQLEPYVSAMEQHWEEPVKGVLRYCQAHKALVYHLYNSISKDRLEQYVALYVNGVFYANIRGRSASEGVPDEMVHELADYCCFAFMGFFLRFLWARMERDVDTAVDNLSSLTEPFVRMALENAKNLQK